LRGRVPLFLRANRASIKEERIAKKISLVGGELTHRFSKVFWGERF